MIITSDILASSSKSTDPCKDGHDVVDGEHYEDDVDVIDVEDSEGLDLELDPLLLGRDAGHPVDLRLHQAHLALRQGRDCSKCYTGMDGLGRDKMAYVLGKEDLEVGADR